jgi:hypothetical protein
MAPSPLQTAAVLSNNGSGSSGSDRGNAHQEVIEVQILPQVTCSLEVKMSVNLSERGD